MSTVRANSAAARVSSAFRRPSTVAVLLSVSAIAYAMLALGDNNVVIVSLCTSAMSWPSTATILDLVLAFNSPAALVAQLVVMIAAMMSPLLLQPLRHLHERSFADRRLLATVLFVVGYGAAWLLAGAGLQTFAIALRFGFPEPYLPLAIGGIIALIWQVSPAKQRCLNGCHRRPALAAFGLAADRDALLFGLRHGVWCVGACWALMLLPFLAPDRHLLAMTATALLLFAERFEPPAMPAWRWRGPTKAVRIVLCQLKARLPSMKDAPDALPARNELPHR